MVNPSNISSIDAANSLDVQLTNESPANITNTRVRCFVDSHNFGRVDLTDSISSYSFEKGIHEAGTLSIGLAPTREWLDLIEANDVINLYVNLNNPHERISYNKGWVRRFFGYIDQVRRKYTAHSDGSVTVVYTVNCTDFQKAFNMTEIYNNPYIPQNEVFGNNLGGSYLMFQGAVNMGNPRFILMNLMAALFAFGRQWILPPHYNEELPAIPENVYESLEGHQRPNDYLATSPQNVSQHFAPTRRKNDAIAVVQELRDLAESFSYAYSQEENINAVFAAREVAARAVGVNMPVLEDWRTRLQFSRAIEVAATSPCQLTITRDSPWQVPKTIYDILCFDYMEYVEGFILDLTIWDYQGSFYDLLSQYSHQVINELIIDLRPVIDFKTTGTDVLGQELEGGVSMVPCVVLRENPFTYYPKGGEGSENLENRILNVADLMTDAGINIRATHVDFGGAVWNQNSRIMDYGDSVGMNVEVIMGLRDGEPIDTMRFNRGLRTFEIFQITQKDVEDEDIGRGDQDVVTGYDFKPETALGDDISLYIRSIVPQFRLIQIRKHGLRMREYVSSFAQFIPEVVQPPRSEVPLVAAGLTSGGVFAGDVGENFTDYMSLRVITLTDHWYQHNIEYLNGTMQLRGMPGLRPGYRLDNIDRGLSFYVESVSESWTFGAEVVTTASVSRGQPMVGLEYIPPDSRVLREMSETFVLGISFPVSDNEYSNENNAASVGISLDSVANPLASKGVDRSRTSVVPGRPGRFSPLPIIQNFRPITVQFPDGINLGGEISIVESTKAADLSGAFAETASAFRQSLSDYMDRSLDAEIE